MFILYKCIIKRWVSCIFLNELKFIYIFMLYTLLIVFIICMIDFCCIKILILIDVYLKSVYK